MSDDKKTKNKDAELKADAELSALSPDGGDEAPSKFGKKKVLLLVLIPLLVLAIAGGVSWKMGLLDSIIGKKKVDCTQVTEADPDYASCADELAKAGGGADKPGVFVDVPDMIVNLNSTSKQPRFLKISLSVELEDANAQKVFEGMLPRVIDQFQTYLRELRLEDLRGSSGMYRMKIELLSRVRAAMPDLKVRDVLFKEILVQ
ncbi:MAG: flagellar basal body-associated FliL family protein [Micavibrio sp.]|nr:flagellar basal body-associated FliL family protein [Micavibrio sp.]